MPCHLGPWRCTGALGSDFLSGFEPNYNLETAWQAGIKVLLGGTTGGMVIGYFVPGRSTYSSALGRDLIKAGYQPPDKGYQAHHIVVAAEQCIPNALESVEHLLEGPGASQLLYNPSNVILRECLGVEYVVEPVRHAGPGGQPDTVLSTVNANPESLKKFLCVFRFRVISWDYVLCGKMAPAVIHPETAGLESGSDRLPATGHRGTPMGAAGR